MESHIAKLKKTLRKHNLVPRVSLLPVPRSGKKRDPGNEVGENRIQSCESCTKKFCKKLQLAAKSQEKSSQWHLH